MSRFGVIKEEDLHPFYQDRTEYDRTDLLCERLMAWQSKVEWEIEGNTDFGKNIHDIDRDIFRMAAGRIKDLEGRVVKLEVDLAKSEYRLKKSKKKVDRLTTKVRVAKSKKVFVKEWNFVHNDKGWSIEGRNLSKLVRANKDLFSHCDVVFKSNKGHSCNATLGLRKLHYRNKTANFLYCWKGWTIG